MQPRVLVSVSSDALRAQLSALLSEYSPEPSDDTPSLILELLDQHASVCLLIIEESPSGTGSFDLMEAAKDRRGDLAVILLSSNPTIEHATEAIRRGAEDFVPVPFSGELLRKEVQRILDAAELRERVESLRHLVKDALGFDRILSHSLRMRPVFERASAAARSDTPVLITGETGTGKELVARAIHANSRRAIRSFVPVNCAALPRDLVETELFGYRRGAFSGAQRDYPGLFLAADRGTLFLDEIGELSMDAQAKLLRALQDGEIRPIGGLASRRVDVRFIAATNRSISELRGEALREDLFYRLSVLVIDLPPLRERVDDIPLLVSHFLAQVRGRGAVHVEGVDNQALEILTAYPFPGNVRELENMVEAICVTLPPSATSIRAEDIRGWMRRRGRVPSFPPSQEPSLKLEELEAWAIQEALRRTRGNKLKAAALLGISRDTLYRKLRELHMDSSGPVRISGKLSKQ